MILRKKSSVADKSSAEATMFANEQSVEDPQDRRPHHVQIPIRHGSILDFARHSLFAPHPAPSDSNPTPAEWKSSIIHTPPEKQLTLLAFRLAILEKSATGLGALAFIWATTVVLSGFLDDLRPNDYAFVTVILVIEGIRIFSRSHELEWQQLPAHPLSNSGRLQLQGDVCWIVASKFISRALSCLQLLSAVTCVTLSLMRLIDQDYGAEVESKRNASISLNLFFGLALGEALIFLVERSYWAWRIYWCRLLENVSREYKLGPMGIAPIRRFFYEIYTKCVNDSVFDGFKMNLVSFAEDLLDSEFHEERLMGLQVLRKLVGNARFVFGTLRKIGSSTSTMERLIEMLNWKNPGEEEIRLCAAEIMSELAGRRRNVLRVAAIPGAMESLSSLLHSGSTSDQINPHELNLLGLLIFKKLSTDHDNCCKIGSTRGLLSKIIGLTGSSRDRDTPTAQSRIVKRSLQLVKMLVETDGEVGKMLRQEISKIVFTVSNIREMIKNGDIQMQKLGIEILKSLSMDEHAKEEIGNTGGVIKLLVSIFFMPRFSDDENYVCNQAGETLAMLALESSNNCDRILKKPEVLKKLIGVLTDPVLRINASRILRNLCAYTRMECYDDLGQVAAAMPTVLKAILKEKEKLLEASVGLVTQLCKFTNADEFARALEQAEIQEIELVEKLVEILKEYEYPDIKVPRIRRFVIEQAIWMMNSDSNSVGLFEKFGMERLLESVEETTSELECFHIFSGSVGLSRHRKTMPYLVETASNIMSAGN
ncbi:uncharacterized protein LOC122034615 [Zingiber officinale]|uniref:ARM repeat superfamily protein n=1 Tax=Zingiber officinale TaxID=94328 RepID=A0A8J5C670_ZINOF|nr:uncharacterized protein LOC122034615 [Zingiber officinale]KAG6467915.1 hypothetical protein ZIOFF_072480 [Zingiber officinale]